jgi:hypothetical protein
MIFQSEGHIQPVRLRLSAKSASQSAVFFSQKNQPIIISASQISLSEQADQLLEAWSSLVHLIPLGNKGISSTHRKKK